MKIEQDRVAQLLIASDDGLDIDDARLRLERSAIILSFDSDAAASEWGQAALFTIARCAFRMFRGGVFVRSAADALVTIGHYRATGLRRALFDLGCSEVGSPSKAFRIHVGSTAPERADLYCMADGWRGIVSPKPVLPGHDANVLSGALAGAMAVSEAFRHQVLSDLLAARRTQIISAWDPANPLTGAPLSRLPQKFWLLGAGNLGQAILFLLGLLPYADTAAVTLLIQDSDTSGPENLMTQLLTDHQWMGRKKALCAARYAEGLGFATIACQRRFGAGTRIEPDEPRVALVGVDNLKARRWAANAGFDLVLDAGLGRSASEIFDIRLHAFPGLRSIEEAWPQALDDPSEAPVLNAGLEKLVSEGRLDRCGAMTIAGQSLGVPSTAVVAAVLQVAQACRAVIDGNYCDFVDVSLRERCEPTAHSATLTAALAALGARS